MGGEIQGDDDGGLVGGYGFFCGELKMVCIVVEFGCLLQFRMCWGDECCGLEVGVEQLFQLVDECFDLL